jgi:hypothetical protein
MPKPSPALRSGLAIIFKALRGIMKCFLIGRI